MNARAGWYVGAVLLAACAGGRGVQVGEVPIGAPMITICLSNPRCLARELETFLRTLRGYEARPVIELRKKISDPESRGDWESLEPWERQLWRDYAARGQGRVDSKRTNLHLTADDRLLMGLDLSLEYMGPGAREEGRRLIQDPLFVGGLVAGVSLYVLLWLNPEPVFTKGTASIITGALLLTFSVQEIVELAFAWKALERETADARTLAEVDRAAAKFGRSVGARGLHILMVIVGKMTGKAVASLPVAAGGAGPPMAAAAAGVGVVVTEGQEIWILQGGVIALAGSGALAVAMSAGGGAGLDQNESSGGHTVEKHVGKTEEDLRARLAAEPDRKVVSTFLSKAEAEAGISAVLRARAKEIATWLAGGAKDRLKLEAPFKGGLVLKREASGCVSGEIARVVLQGDGAGRWYVLTAMVDP